MYTANASLDSTSFVTPGDLKVAASELPPSPQVFGKLGKLLRDPNTGLNDITELVNTDASLTTRVLKLSNSAAFLLAVEPTAAARSWRCRMLNSSAR